MFEANRSYSRPPDLGFHTTTGKLGLDAAADAVVRWGRCLKAFCHGAEKVGD